MSLITWTEEQHGTSVGFIDTEHKELFARLNKVYDDVAGGAERSQIGVSLDSLISYVVDHFAHEEKEMIAANYAGYDQHKEEHTKLLETCGGLQTAFHAGDAEVTAEVAIMVKDWLDSHIPTFDKATNVALS